MCGMWVESPKTKSFSGGQFCFVVETLHSGGGNHSFCPEPIENEAPMFAERFGYFLHGLDPGPHGPGAPAVEEAPGPVRGEVIPEGLEIFFQEVAADRFQSVLKKVGKYDFLSGGKIFGTLEQQPARTLENRLVAIGLQLADFLSPHFIDSLAHVGHDVETVQDVNRLGCFLSNDPKVGLPHIRTDELES